MTEQPANPEFERIRAYLQVQAREKSTEALVTRVQAGVDELHAAARAVPASRWEVPHEGEEWSPRGCLEHAIKSDAGVARAVLHVALTGEQAPSDEETTVPEDRESAIAQHKETFDSLYAHVLEADPKAFLDVTWEHKFFGQLNWREWLLFLRIHTKDHADQLKKMMQ